MNARVERFEICCDRNQIEDVVTCIMHTLLMHRSTGKYSYSSETQYNIGSVGTEDIDCENIDLTYVRVGSASLATKVRSYASEFAAALLRCTQTAVTRDLHAPSSSVPAYTTVRPCTGLFSLEFVTKKQKSWHQVLEEDTHPWEVWHVGVNVVPTHSQQDALNVRETVADGLSELIYTIVACVNRPQFLPKTPTQRELANVFDTSYDNIQPYLYRVKTEVGNAKSSATSLTSTFKQLLADTILK